MAKSKIIKEIANGDVDLQTSLKRALIIASDIGNENLKQWIQKELSGYSKGDELPDYRKLKGVYKITYYLFGKQKKDEPIPANVLFGEEHASSDTYYCYDNIGFLESACKDEHLRRIIRIEMRKYMRRQVDSFYLEIPQSEFGNAIAKISANLLAILLQIDNELGSLDNLDVCPENEEKRRNVNKNINNYFGTVIKIGDHNEINKSDILGGNSDGK